MDIERSPGMLQILFLYDFWFAKTQLISVSREYSGYNGAAPISSLTCHYF